MCLFHAPDQSFASLALLANANTQKKRQLCIIHEVDAPPKCRGTKLYRDTVHSMEEGITNEKHYTYACKLRGALSPTLDFRAIYACSGPSPRPRSHAHHTNSGTPTGEHIHGKHPTTRTVRFYPGNTHPCQTPERLVDAQLNTTHSEHRSPVVYSSRRYPPDGLFPRMIGSWFSPPR